MFRKVLLVALFSAFLFGSDFWETGFVQGYSTYNIVNTQKERLLFECNESTANFYLYKKDEQININNQDISFIINNERKFITINEILNQEQKVIIKYGLIWYQMFQKQRILSLKRIILNFNLNHLIWKY